MKHCLIPGAGGTQRLSPPVGVAKATEMCAPGEPIDAVDGWRHGLVNYVEEVLPTRDLTKKSPGINTARQMMRRPLSGGRHADLAEEAPILKECQFPDESKGIVEEFFADGEAKKGER